MWLTGASAGKGWCVRCSGPLNVFLFLLAARVPPFVQESSSSGGAELMTVTSYKHPSLFLPGRRFVCHARGLVTATATEEERWAHADPFLLPRKTLPHCRRQSNEALPELLHLLDKNFTHYSQGQRYLMRCNQTYWLILFSLIWSCTANTQTLHKKVSSDTTQYRNDEHFNIRLELALLLANNKQTSSFNQAKNGSNPSSHSAKISLTRPSSWSKI